jgi:hypothetical protein
VAVPRVTKEDVKRRQKEHGYMSIGESYHRKRFCHGPADLTHLLHVLRSLDQGAEDDGQG